MVLPAIFGRAVLSRLATRLGFRSLPSLGSVSRSAFKASQKFLSTRRGKLAVLGGSAILASPTLTRKTARAVKKDPTLLLLPTPLAGIPIGRQTGKAIQRGVDAPKGQKLRSIAKGAGLVAGGAALTGAAIAAVSKIRRTPKKVGQLALSPTGTPAALAAPIAGAIPTQAAVGAKEPEAAVLPAPVKSQPIRVTSSPKINVVIQNAFS